MAGKTKDVRILVKGVAEAFPEDRVAYLVHQVMGARSASIEVETVGAGSGAAVAEEQVAARVARHREGSRSPGKGDAGAESA
jgi:hypothetical protein